MRDKWTSNAVFCVMAAALAAPVFAAENPCDAIGKACVSAGYKQGEAKEGEGLYYDCVDPIMKGKKATGKKQPDITPQMIAACKAVDPNFPASKTKPKT